jgi:hypothetical protein
MFIIISPIQLFLGLCIVSAAAFGLGVGIGLKAEVTRKDENKPR